MSRLKQILLIISLLNSFKLVPSAQTSRLKIYPADPEVLVTTRATRVLTCKLLGNSISIMSTEDIFWTGPNQLDNAEDLKRKHQIYTDTNYSKITFKNLKIEDSGTYYCFARDKFTNSLNASIEVRVVHRIEFKDCNERQSLIKGSRNGRLNCTFSPEESQTSFLKDKKPLTDYSSRYHWNNADAIEINGEVNESDAGIYQVELTSLADGSTLFRDINVQVR